MKSYPLRTSITSKNELKTCCNLDSVIKPVSQFHGEWGREKTPEAIFGVVGSPERDPEEPRVPPVLDVGLVWQRHNEAIWLWILLCISIKPPKCQTSRLRNHACLNGVQWIISIIMWEMIAEIPSYMFPRINKLAVHTQLHILGQTDTQHIEQDKPLRAVGGCCVIGLCGATASLIINSSEDHTALITLSLSEWRWSQKRAYTLIHRCPAYYVCSTLTHVRDGLFISTIIATWAAACSL